jgi:hypothetical protein
MPDITYQDDLMYEDLGDSIEVKLLLEGEWLYVDTPIERVTINETSLRYEGMPSKILSYVINDHPNETVTALDLSGVGLGTSRDLRQIAMAAGIKGYVRALFMPTCTKGSIKIVNPIKLRAAEVEELINTLT